MAAAFTRCAAPARLRESRPAPATSPCSIPQGSTDLRRSTSPRRSRELRAYCQEAGNDVVSTVTFTVTGLRRDAGPARRLVLPYFDVALRGGATSPPSSRLCRAELPGREPARDDRARASVRVNRGAASLPANVRAILTRPRKAGEARPRSIRWPSPAFAKPSPTRPSSIWSASSSPRTSSSITQRVSFSPSAALTSPHRPAKARRVAGSFALRNGRAGEFRRALARRTPKEQPPPESLRHQGPRAPDSLESVRAKAGRRRGKALRR